MKVLLTTVGVLMGLVTMGQDLFQPNQRIRYARDLMNRYQFNAAISELQAITSNDQVRDTVVALWYDCLMNLGRTQPAGFLLDSTYGPLSSKKKLHHAAFYATTSSDFYTVVQHTKPDSNTACFYGAMWPFLTHRNWSDGKMPAWSSPSSLGPPWNEALNRWYADRLRFEPKKPALAGILSLIPGGGQWYVGNKGDAMMALTTVGLFAFQTYRGQHLRGWKNGYTITFGMLTAGFYIGNVYGGQAAAKRFNESRLSVFDSRLKTISERFSSVD